VAFSSFRPPVPKSVIAFAFSGGRVGLIRSLDGGTSFGMDAGAGGGDGAAMGVAGEGDGDGAGGFVFLDFRSGAFVPGVRGVPVV